jgi:death-on-curing protein
MKEPVWITEKLVMTVHEMLLAEHGGLSGVRDMGLLESALSKPQQLYHYQAESSLFDLATAYSFGLAKNHPFADGNKRIAFTIAAVFLELNGKALNAPEAEVVVFYEALAAGELSEKSLSQWFSDRSS